MATRLLAHRGASQDFPEHTRAAFIAALDQGADGIECDVRLSKDGEVVCFHDATLDRTTNSSGLLHAHSLAELRGLDLSSWHSPGLDGEGIVTLAELLDILLSAERRLLLAIELKHPNAAGLDLERRVLDVLQRSGWDAGSCRLGEIEISFMSFADASIDYFANRVPAAALVMLTDTEAEAVRRRGLVHPPRDATEAEDVAALRADLDRGRERITSQRVGRAGPSMRMVREEPARLRSWLAAGLGLRVWTVDEPVDVARCRELGVEEITTNRPAALRAAMTVST